MKKPLLVIKNLQATVEGKIVIHDFSAELNSGEIVFLMGANGSGKSSLANVLLGNTEYRISNIENSKITFEGEDLLAMTIDERSKSGLFVAWQNPTIIPGVTVFNLCKSSYEAHGNKIESLTEFKRKLELLAEKVGLSIDHIARNVNEGFSGGERKRLELLQLLLLKPKLAVLDEIDSGIDSEGIKTIVEILQLIKTEGVSIILITHNKRLLKEVEADQTWEMKNGRLSAGI